MKYEWLNRVTKLDQLPEKLQGLAQRFQTLFKESGLDKKGAEQMAVQAVKELMEEFEGEEIYINKVASQFEAARNAAIREEFRRAKRTAQTEKVPFKRYLERMCHKYDLTERRLRTIAGDHEDQKELFT